MSHSTRDSDEDPEMRTVRKTRSAVTGLSVVDSPLRRSTRIRQPNNKNNESSPDSPVSDVGGKQTTRATRRRAGTMDSAITDSPLQRRVRSRKGSFSSDVSEAADADSHMDTPTKRNTRRSITASMDTSKTNTRIRRYTRAGSEAKSPPPAVKTRRTRASSMDPEPVAESLGKDRLHNESSGTLVKTRRRASVLPSESTVMEVIEEKKILYVNLEKAVIEVDTVKESESDEELKSTEMKSGKSPITNKEKGIENDISDKESLDAASEITTDGVSVSGTSQLLSHKHDSSEKIGISDSDVSVIGVECVTIDNSNKSPQYTTEETSKILGLKIENLLNISGKPEEKSPGNKENLHANIITDLPSQQIREAVLSPKVTLSTLPQKLMKEKECLPVKEFNLVKNLKDTYLTDATDVNTDTVINIDASTDIEKLNAAKEHRSDDNDNDNVVTAEQDVTDNLLNEEKRSDSLHSEKITDNNELDAGSSFDNKFAETSRSICERNDSSDTVILDSETLNKVLEQEQSAESANEKDNSVQMIEASSIELKESNDSVTVSSNVGTASVDHTTEGDGENITLNATCNKSEDENDTAMDVSQDNSSSNNILEQNELDVSVKTVAFSSSDLNPEKSSEKSRKESAQDKTSGELTISQSCHIVDRSMRDSSIDADQDERTSISLSESVLLRSPDSVVDTNNTRSDNNGGEVSNVIKNTESSTVTDPTVEATEDVSNENKEVEKNGIMSKPSQKLEETKPRREEAEVGSDSDTNIGNLFKDISAEEWKKKNLEKMSQKQESENSSVHSMSTEKLDNESEAECDLVLVDREAWLAAEQIKAVREKETFDYDSDDTVVMKSRLDQVKDMQKIEKMRMISEEYMDVDIDDILENSMKRKSLKAQEPISREEDEDITNLFSTSRKSLNKSASLNTEQADESNLSHSTSAKKIKNLKRSFSEDTDSTEKTNLSLRERKSLNKSLSEIKPKSNKINVFDTSRKENVTDLSCSDEEDIAQTLERNRSLNKSLNTSLKRSLNTSLSTKQNMDIDSDDDIPQSEKSVRKSLNKSKGGNSSMADVEMNTSAKRESNSSIRKQDGNQSLDVSLNKSVKTKHVSSGFSFNKLERRDDDAHSENSETDRNLIVNPEQTKRKSLNRSKIDDTEITDLEKEESAVNVSFKKGKVQQALNTSSNKNQSSKQVDGRSRLRKTVQESDNDTDSNDSEEDQSIVQRSQKNRMNSLNTSESEDAEMVNEEIGKRITTDSSYTSLGKYKSDQSLNASLSKTEKAKNLDKDSRLNTSMRRNFDEQNSVDGVKRKSLNKSNIEAISDEVDAELSDGSSASKAIDETKESNRSFNTSLSKKIKAKETSKSSSTRVVARKDDEASIDEESDSSNSATAIVKKRQSLDTSTSKKAKEKKSNVSASIYNFTDHDEESNHENVESDNESNSTDAKSNDGELRTPLKGKRNSNKNYSILVHIGSDSDHNNKDVETESSESEDQGNLMLKYLYKEDSSDDENSNESLNSDIEKEYNLCGKSITKYDDDDVAGDECRDSESEYSDSEDDGSDLADFVVDDDDAEEEEEGEGDEIDVENTSEDDQNDCNEENNEDTGQESPEEESRESNDENQNVEMGVFSDDSDSCEKEDIRKSSTNASQKTSDVVSSNSLQIEDKIQETRLSSKQNRTLTGQLNESEIMSVTKFSKLNRPMECSTPKINSTQHEKLGTSLKALDAASLNKINKSDIVQNISMKKKLSDFTPKRKDLGSNIRATRSLLRRSLPTDLNDLTEETEKTAVKPILPKSARLNKSMYTPDCESPTTMCLMKMKLNETAPELKLVDVSKKRKSLGADNKEEGLVEDDNEGMTNTCAKVGEATDQVERRRKKPKTVIVDEDIEVKDEKTIKESVGKKSANKQKQPVGFSSTDETSVNKTEAETQQKKKKNKVAKVVQWHESVIEDKNNEKFETLKLSTKKKNKNKELVENAARDSEKAVTVGKKKNKNKNADKQTVEMQQLPAKTDKSGGKLLEKKLVKPPKKQQMQKENIPKSKIAPERSAFSTAREEALNEIRRITEKIKSNTEMKKQKRSDYAETTEQRDVARMQNAEEQRGKSATTKRGLKRLPDDVCMNLSEITARPKKRAKCSNKEEPVRPSRTMPANTGTSVSTVKDTHVPLSSSGGTTEFSVVNLQKVKKQQAKKVATVAAFRQKMIARNARHPISAYLMYIQKQKASGKDKFSGKPY